jgi:hypothetical protein
MGEQHNEPFQLSFDSSLRVDFQGSRVTSDGGLILVRERCPRDSLGDGSRKSGRAGGEGTERCLWSRRHRRQLWFQAARAGQNGHSWGRLGTRRRKNIADMTRRGASRCILCGDVSHPYRRSSARRGKYEAGRQIYTDQPSLIKLTRDVVYFLTHVFPAME